jgi:hypothetical protein
MKPLVITLALAALVLPVALPAGGQESAKPHSLCKPGFIFIELVTDRVADYIAFFEKVTDFKVSRNDGDYACLRSELGELVFMERKGLPDGHPNKRPPGDTGRGLGIEIVVIVADLDRAFAKSADFKQQGWKLSAGIGRRPWGARDFRIISPDGYYLRFSEAM